jgi:S1-C subfamily serine protease
MSVTMSSLSQELAGAVAESGRHVVRIEGRRRGPSSGVVWSGDGLVVTNHHVLERDEGIAVGLPDGRTTTAKVVGRDPGTDIALLRADATGLEAPAWGEADTLRVGFLALAVSRPGRSARARLGVVSALGDSWRTPAGGRLDRYVETDVAIEVAFSGSALVGADGALLGLNTAGLLRGTSLALPPATVRRVAEALLAHGRVPRGYLGIGTYPVELPLAWRERMGQAAALVVLSVQAKSAAAEAGLLVGDLLLAMEGHSLEHPRELFGLLDEDRIGKESVLRIVRAGEPREIRLTIGTRPGHE